MENQNKSIIYLGFNNPMIHKRGVENVILFQSRSLEKNTKKYYIFFGEKDERFMWEDINCISIKHNLFRFLKMNKKIKEISKKEMTIIHSHNYLMSFFLLKKTDILTVHDGLYYLSKQVNHKFKNIFKFIEKRVYKKTRLVHFISEFSKEQSLYQGNKSRIIYNTTPLEEVKINYGKKKQETDKLKIFTVRSMEERANIDLLIELAEKKQDYDIKIAGKGPLLNKYKKIINDKKLSNIELLGYISDEEVGKYYFDCDIVVVTAKYGEGFGLPIIEGYLYNKPVFASNICAVPEIIINKDFLVENNLKDLEMKIEKYLSKKENITDFKEYYNKKFSYKKILEKYKELLYK